MSTTNRRPLRHVALLLVSAFISLTGGYGLAEEAAPPAHVSAGPASWVADELLVAHHPGIDRPRVEEIYRSHGATIVDEIPQIRTHLLRVAPSALESVRQALARRPEIEFVERNYVMPAALTPNDANYWKEWHLEKINAPSAWDVSTGDSGVVIAILDSGIDSSHPDLAAKIVPGYNAYDNNSDTSDVGGHGTMVAGSAAAISNNGAGVASVAWQNPLMPIRVTDTQGSGYASTIAKGLTWAADHGARVMNISFSGVAASSAITSAAQYVAGKGGLVVAAAGNCGCADPTAENLYILSVSATNTDDTLASFSSTGSYVDVAAPGVSIQTTVQGGGYSSVSGTSFSSPITAGVLALMMSANPALGPSVLEYLLESTAVDLGSPGFDKSFGFGRIDAAAAVNAALASAQPPPDTTAPSVSISSPASGSVVSGVATVDVTAFDDRGVSRVELYVDGALLATDTAAPFSFAWDTSRTASGSRGLQAKAFDASGNVGTSATVQVTVATTDTTPPQVRITSPTTGSTATKSVKIALSATDSSKLTTLQAFVDGVSLGSSACSASSCSATFTWNAQKATRGSHVLSGVAYDSAGNAGNANPVTVYVN